MTVEVVILAMIAAFLGLRLYAVLGRRAEHEEETIQGRVEAKSEAGAAAPRAPAPRVPERGGAPGALPGVRELPLPGVLPAA
ncbi:MAG TPA: Tim44 domain-containing protein, partial [Novosphingobium sp.]